jgi:hypothetical protein
MDYIQIFPDAARQPRPRISRQKAWMIYRIFIAGAGIPPIYIWTSYFQARVEEDGGTFEASRCVTDALAALGSKTYYDLFELYRLRMEDDGATFDNPCFDELMYTLALLK